MKINNFNLKKNEFISKYCNIINEMDENIITMDSNANDNKKEKLIKIENNRDEFFESLFNHGEYIIHKSYNFSLNKMIFVENISKELTKIVDNELNIDNNNEHNLIMGSKKLISDLLLRSDILNSNLNIEIKMNYYYDRPFYFINVKDEKKLMLKITKYISENRRKVNNVPLPSANYFRQGSIKLRKVFANYNPLRKESDELDKYSIESSNYYDNTKKVIYLCKN